MKINIIILIVMVIFYSCDNKRNKDAEIFKQAYHLEDDNVYVRHWIVDDTAFYEYFKDINFDTLVSFSLEYEEDDLIINKSFRPNGAMQGEVLMNTLNGRIIYKEYYESGNLSRQIIEDSIVWKNFITSILRFSEQGDTIGDFLIDHAISKIDEKKFILTYKVVIDEHWQDSIQVQLWKTMLGGEITVFESRLKMDTVILDMSKIESEVKCGAFNLLHYDNDLKTWVGIPVPFNLKMTN